jgi:DNA primase
MAHKRQYRVDFAAVKRAVPLERVLSHYGLLEGLKRVGSQLTGSCPIHNGSNRKQFVVDLNKDSWRCFGDCDRGGGTLELVAEIERVGIYEAATRIARWFGIKTADGAYKGRKTPMSKGQTPT